MLTQLAILFALPLLPTPTLADQVYAESAIPYDTPTGTASSSPSINTGIVYDIDVGLGGLFFGPSAITAAPGDILNFHFYPQNHSVAASTFDSPCEPMPNSLFSGFMPVSDDKPDMKFSVTVVDSEPMWLYCTQGRHCQNGMVMVVNPPLRSETTLDAYAAAAARVETNRSPDSGVAGGEVTKETDEPGVEDAESSGGMTSSAASMTGSSTAAAASASSTGAAAGLVRPAAAAAGVVGAGILAAGLTVWT